MNDVQNFAIAGFMVLARKDLGRDNKSVFKETSELCFAHSAVLKKRYKRLVLNKRPPLRPLGATSNHYGSYM